LVVGHSRPNHRNRDCTDIFIPDLLLEATDQPPFPLGLCRSFGLSNGDEALRILHQNCLANHKGHFTTVDCKATWGADTVKPWLAQSQ
jgi:hypothetical protein